MPNTPSTLWRVKLRVYLATTVKNVDEFFLRNGKQSGNVGSRLQGLERISQLVVSLRKVDGGERASHGSIGAKPSQCRSCLPLLNGGTALSRVRAMCALSTPCNGRPQ